VPETTEDGFPHGKHVDKGTCAGCHPDTGHVVTPAALKAAGI
jgi:mono/diheme cytochrome c family protein